MMPTSFRLTVALSLAACGSSSHDQHDAPANEADAAAGSMYHAFPFDGGTGAPVVSAVQLRCTPEISGNGNYVIESRVSATDPLGPSALSNFGQDYLGVYPQDPPAGTEAINSFHFNDTGGVVWAMPDQLDATWGVVPLDNNVSGEICAAHPSTWPVDILVEDNTGNITSGLVRAPFVVGS